MYVYIFTRGVWFVVVSKPLVCTSSVHYRPVRTAQQHAAVPRIDHVQLVLTAVHSGRSHNAHCCRRAAGLLGFQELCVDRQHHLLGRCVVYGATLRIQLVVETLGTPRRTHLYINVISCTLIPWHTWARLTSLRAHWIGPEA